jgi:septal ring factor EnvC (AmiA/AmiB activator)
MKENTKFLWMYVAILFSFALILIIFAGLSHNSSTEQTKGLKADITELSHKNTELQNKNTELQKNLDALTAEHEQMKTEYEALKLDDETKKSNDEALMAAIKAYNSGNFGKSKQIKSTIDPESLTEAQLYIYNKLVY